MKSATRKILPRPERLSVVYRRSRIATGRPGVNKAPLHVPICVRWLGITDPSATWTLWGQFSEDPLWMHVHISYQQAFILLSWRGEQDDATGAVCVCVEAKCSCLNPVAWPSHALSGTAAQHHSCLHLGTQGSCFSASIRLPDLTASNTSHSKFHVCAHVCVYI